MGKKWNFSVLTMLMVGLLMAGVALAANVPNDQPDSSAYVGKDWNGYLPAFKDANGVSIPFIPTSTLPPIGYQGDFYVDEFTDAKIKQVWQELKEKDPAAAKKILANVYATAKSEKRFTGSFDPKFDPKYSVNGNDDLKLTDIRRPAFFGQTPWFEDIAKVEQDTYTVEFTVPGGLYEQLQLKQMDPIKLRGWFIKGKGVSDAEGKRIHALFMWIPGHGTNFFAVNHPNDPKYIYNVQKKQYEGIPYPNKQFQTEQWNSSHRQILYAFNQVGFDVLAVDNRAVGYSGGLNSRDNTEMAEDIFRKLDQLESGEGLTVLTPSGQLLQGKQTAGLLLRGMSAKQVPVLISGQSYGSVISCYAMQKNFVGWTAYNEPSQKFTSAKKYNLKGALLISNFAGGLGYVNEKGTIQAVYEEAVRRIETYTMPRPTSEILANIDRWPAVFFGQGLWDYLESPEGVYEAYSRAKGLKELMFYRAGHTMVMGTKIVPNLLNKMTEFAVRAVVNPSKKYPELQSFKEAVLSSEPEWDPTSRP
jgi:hypothetical protein